MADQRGPGDRVKDWVFARWATWGLSDAEDPGNANIGPLQHGEGQRFIEGAERRSNASVYVAPGSLLPLAAPLGAGLVLRIARTLRAMPAPACRRGATQMRPGFECAEDGPSHEPTMVISTEGRRPARGPCGGFGERCATAAGDWRGRIG